MQEIIIFADQVLLDPHSQPTSGIDALLALLACWQCCSVGTIGLLALLACWYCWPTKAYNQVVLHLIMLLCFVTCLL